MAIKAATNERSQGRARRPQPRSDGSASDEHLDPNTSSGLNESSLRPAQAMDPV